MSIAYVTQADAASSTVTLPSYSSGDLAIVWAFRDGSTTAPTDDANYTTLVSSGANTCSLKIAARKLTSGDPNPSFANATEIGVVILRADAGEFAGSILTLFGSTIVAGASSTQPSYGTLAGLVKSHSFIVGMGGHRAATDMNSPAGPGSMTKRAPGTNTLALHTLADAIAFTGGNFGATVNSSSGWRTYAVEVLGNRTQMFPTGAEADGGRGLNDAKLAGGGANAWESLALSTSRGAGVTSNTTATVAGPTSGVEHQIGPDFVEWLSKPLDADVTISAPIEMNLRMSRSAAGNNMGPQIVIERLDSTGAIVSTVLNSEMGTENLASETAMNWLATPTSTSFNRGDKLRVRVAYNDAGGTAASGGTETFYWSGTAAGASGDSYLIFGEKLTFVSEPAGTTVYLSTTAAGINPGSANEYEAWTSRGSGATTAVTNTTSGFTAPLQATETAGGTALEWYTRPLVAFTLGGAIRCNVRVKDSAGDSNATARVEVAVCDADGSNPVVWGSGNGSFLTSSEAARSFLIAGDDTTVAAGKRLRIRLYVDDAEQSVAGAFAMLTGRTVTVYYAGTSGGASGDTYLTFTQTLNEAVTVTPDVLALTLTTYAPTVTASAGNVTATPDTAALTTTTFAPTVSVSDNKLVTPDVAALATTGYAPVIGLGIIPDAASLTLTTATFVPTAFVSDNQLVVPDLATLTLTTFAPTVSLSDNILVTPDVVALNLATFAPTVAISDNRFVTPDTASLSLSSFVPTVSVSDNIAVTPDAVALNLTAFAPVVTAGGDQTVTPDTAALTLTGYAPTVTATGTGHAFVQAIIIV